MTGRRNNPSVRPGDTEAKLEQASRLYRDFSGHEPAEVLKVRENRADVGLVIGELDGVLYSTVRDGKAERYIHRFKRRSRPLLVSSHDGEQLGIVGGQFQFTEAGIEDR